MKKKISLKLSALLVVCLISVFCIQMPIPAQADGVCTDNLEFCEAGCSSGNTCCFDRCWNEFVDCDKSGRFEKVDVSGCPVT